MKKTLFLFSVLMSVNAVAQTYPAQRIQYGEHTADIQPVVIDDHHANINIKNPYGDENVTMEVQEDKNGRVKMVMKDKNTGKIISTVEGVENRYVDSTSEINGVRKDIHLKSVGEDLRGTVGYSNKNTGEELFANILGDGVGSVNQSKEGYKMSLHMENGDSGTVTYTNTVTKQVVCTVVYNKDKSRVFDGNKKLIAEGNSEDDNPSKVYDRAAWQKCSKVMDILSDDDDD